MNPIEMAVFFHGEDLHLDSPDGGGSSHYDPSSPDNFAPGPPDGAKFRGAWEHAYIAGLEGQRDQSFLVDTSIDPCIFKEMVSTITRKGIRFTISKVRERHHSGVLAGYEIWVVR